MNRTVFSLLAVAMWLSFAAPVLAQEDAVKSFQVQLEGVTVGEGDGLVQKLQDLQRQVKAGEKTYFTLLSGAPAYYPSADISPRQAFLQLPFDKIFSIRREGTDSRHFKVVVAPDGLGRLMWNLEVTMGFSGQVERLEMVNEPPPPF